MAIKILSAHGSEQNLGINGAVGDQLQTSTPDTSGEIRIMDFYVDPLGWYVMRAKEEKERKAIAEAAEIAANNKHVGYGQDNRGGVVAYGVDSNIDVNGDCSSIARACCRYAGFDPGNFYTGNQVAVLSASGHFLSVMDFDTMSESDLLPGDILVTKKKKHTITIISVDAKASNKEEQKETSVSVNVDIDDAITLIAKDVINGDYGNGHTVRAKKIYEKIRAYVNEGEAACLAAKNGYAIVAYYVIQGNFGNGHEKRKTAIYELVRARVNELAEG